MNNNLILLENNKLVIGQTILDVLQASAGDRLTIEYAEKDEQIIPVIIKSDGGNVLSKKGTISFRGKVNEILASYGTTFEAEVQDGVIYLKGNNPQYTVYTSPKKAVEHVDKKVLEDTTFDINIDTYEF